MRVLLLNPPAARYYVRDNYCTMSVKGRYAWPPIDLLVLSGQLRAAHDVLLLDANVLGLDAAEARARIDSFAPDVIVAVTGTVSWTSDRAFLVSIARPGRRLFVSGGFLLTRAEAVLASEPWLEGVLLNYVFSGLAAHLAGDTAAPRQLAVRRPDGAVVVRRDAGAHDFRTPPGAHAELPLGRYALPTARRAPLTAVIASIGCPFSCTFCISSIVAPLQRAIDDVVDELRAAAAAGAREVIFLDQTFTAGRRRTLALCEAIAAARLGLTWSCQTHVSTVSAEVLSAMRRAGCHTVHFGVESASEGVLDHHEKRATRPAIREAFALARAAGLRTLGYFIIGLPGETEASTRETIDLALELDPDFASFSFAVPDVGTALAEEVERNGWHARPEARDSSHDAVLATQALSVERSRALMDEAVRRFYLRPGYVARLARDVRSPHELRNFALNGASLLASSVRRGLGTARDD